MRISRKEMEEIIHRGESVIIDGQIYTTVESLPTEAELALGNKEQEEVARKSLKAQMEQLKAQMSLLDAEVKEAKEEEKEAKAEAKTEAKEAKSEEKKEEKK